MKQKLRQYIPESLRSKFNIALLVTAAVLVEGTSAVQYWFAKEGITREVQHRAESELRAKRLEIQNVMNVVEVAVNNMAWTVQQQLSHPDSMLAITQKLIASNEYIVGSAIAFEPYYYKGKGRQFSPYTYQHDGITTCKQLGSDEYDYHSMEWYTSPMVTGHCHWSEPYYDKGGGEMMMATYSVPICDNTGQKVAVFTADLSLDWLSELINAEHFYPSSYNLLLSHSGQIMACPVESLVMRQTITQATSKEEDTIVNLINRKMLAGESGQATVNKANGEKHYVFYAQMDDETGWSMAVVCSDNDIFSGLRQVVFYLFLLMLLGLCLMGFIILGAANATKRLQKVNAEKERISSELHIASDIQKGMLPKTFPPYPERDDVEIFGSLVSAKEVGGDLYDFFIRDEKLFFCIGDVSGKGVPASLVMAVTRSLFRSVSAHEANPDRIVTIINDSMAQMNESNMFITMFLGVLDLPTGRLRYCNAGHCPPLLIGDSVSIIPVHSNLPVGALPGYKFEGQELPICPQSTIFLYTDGLTEAENTAHEQFGESRIMKESSDLQTHAPQQLIEQMSSAVHSFVGEAEQSDDLTMLAIQYTKSQLDVRLERSLTLQNDIQQVPQLSEWIEEVCEAVGFDAATTMQMNLAMEEAVVNVMSYAYPKGTVGDINILAQANDVRLKFTIIDSGSPFDPTAHQETDTTLSLEERPIGGLGIHLVRQLMDSINYERIEEAVDNNPTYKIGKNVLTLRKKLK